jgi:hypothetical protein
MIDGSVELDHVRAGYNFIKHCEWRWSFGVSHAFAFSLFRKCDFDFNFSQAFDQGLDASRTQSLDQLVGWCFVSIRQKYYVTHLI